jgi:glycine cleavage system H protein
MDKRSYSVKAGKANLKVPREFFYSDQHAWIDGKTGAVGVTDFFQLLLGDVVFVELVEAGTEVKRSGEIGHVEALKSVLDLYSPVSGSVVEVNPNVATSPETINLSPYETGWLLKISPTNMTEELQFLMDAKSYAEYVRREIRKERARKKRLQGYL